MIPVIKEGRRRKEKLQQGLGYLILTSQSLNHSFVPDLASLKANALSLAIFQPRKWPGLAVGGEGVNEYYAGQFSSSWWWRDPCPSHSHNVYNAIRKHCYFAGNGGN